MRTLIRHIKRIVSASSQSLRRYYSAHINAPLSDLLDARAREAEARQALAAATEANKAKDAAIQALHETLEAERAKYEGRRTEMARASKDKDTTATERLAEALAEQKRP